MGCLVSCNCARPQAKSALQQSRREQTLKIKAGRVGRTYMQGQSTAASVSTTSQRRPTLRTAAPSWYQPAMCRMGMLPSCMRTASCSSCMKGSGGIKPQPPSTCRLDDSCAVLRERRWGCRASSTSCSHCWCGFTCSCDSRDSSSDSCTGSVCRILMLFAGPGVEE